MILLVAGLRILLIFQVMMRGRTVQVKASLLKALTEYLCSLEVSFQVSLDLARLSYTKEMDQAFHTQWHKSPGEMHRWDPGQVCLDH
jgi:hypothetical protein